MFDTSSTIENYDPELAKAIDLEERRQEEHIELIASENYASNRVMAAQGSVLTNKYAEGYPWKRYYGGCEYVDDVESLAIERARSVARVRSFCAPVEISSNATSSAVRPARSTASW